jgi:uncharacterized membrane protein
MSNVRWSLSEDLPWVGIVGVAALVVATVVLLLLELRARERNAAGFALFATGVGGAALLALAVLRPVEVASRGTLVGPRIVVLVDQSRRLKLPDGAETRRDVTRRVVRELREHYEDARLDVLGFGAGAPRPVGVDGFDPTSPPTAESDLVSALDHVAGESGERPAAIVVVSDGRFSRPAAGADAGSMPRIGAEAGATIHGVHVAGKTPPDASILSVREAGMAVAHQPLSLTVEVACTGGLACDEVPVRVKELRQGAVPAELASGIARPGDGSVKVDLEITLERAGERVLSVSIDAPPGDVVPENDERFLTFSVTRERMRLLHLAGRPTYDVRALRTWLKSDESVDVVAFFILRTQSDDPEASEQELALIEFPVMELFTTHLPSFDAIVLQDIDAIEYKLARYLPAVTRYVEAGGGLIMVGGPSSFAGGNYAGTPLDGVFPVEPALGAEPFSTADVRPRYTAAGRAAPVTAALRELLGETLPTMVGYNFLGAPRPGALVLWEHPEALAGEQPMPLLALGEAGDGRTIALGLDGTHRLAFSELAATVAGRAYGALWDGLLGWLMRDPRYEGARIALDGECIAGEPARLRVTRLPGTRGAVDAEIVRLGDPERQEVSSVVDATDDGPIRITVESPVAGGYSARVRVGEAPPTRYDFSCEAGGVAFADVRPDRTRFEAIVRSTGGTLVDRQGTRSLPSPPGTQITAERRVAPVAPPWIWTVLAASFLGGHWILRRREGLV